MSGYSGISVLARPGEVDLAAAALAALPALEVHAVDRASGTIVVVQEGATLGDHEAGLRAIQGLPSVLKADLHYHFVDDGTAPLVLPTTPSP